MPPQIEQNETVGGVRPAALGKDLGSLYSKMALSFPRLDSPDQVQISRVGFHGLLQDPDYPETNHAHEFISLAAPDKDRTTMVEGKAALKEDKCIPIKTMLVYLALHKARPYRSTLVFVRLPRGECLLSMIREGTITDCMMRDVIIKHLERLRRMALEQARKNGVEITLLGVTYPHYLFLNQGSSDFDDFMDTYLGLLSSVWGSITFRVISEGQAIAKYICVPFYDSIGGAIREQIAELFKGLQLKRAWVRLIIVDGGSSSLNVYSVFIWFDEEGRMSHSQSYFRPGQLRGAQGGSHTANDEVSNIVAKVLEKMESRGIHIPPGIHAEFLLDFDRQKRRGGFNYMKHVREEKSISLNNDNGFQLRVDLPPTKIARVFSSAFSRGLSATRAELKGALSDSVQCPTGILFCGGSYMAEGLREQASAIIRKEQARSAGNKDVRYEFLGNMEGHWWSTAVSAGAAMALQTTPPLEPMMRGFTIGLQRIHRQTSRPRRGQPLKSQWQGENTAEVLFSEGRGPARPSKDTLPLEAATSNRLRFSLICDPLYQTDRKEGELDNMPRIKIEPPRKVDTQSEDRFVEDLSPYDLGCTLSASDIPPGNVRFALGGRRFRHLSEGRFNDAVIREQIPIIFTCVRVNRLGTPLKDPADKKYLLWIKPDPVTNFPIVGQEEDFKRGALPFWCTGCRGEIDFQGAKICQDCPATFCMSCFVSGIHGEHPREHKIRNKKVKMDY